MTQSIGRVDHTIPKEEAIFGFGPEMKPILEADPGEVVTFETHDCFSGQIETESDLVTDIDFSKVNPATGPLSVRGAEPGDRPMVGVVGVATGGAQVVNAMPGKHGGNLDDHLHGVGTSIYFPVRQRGGMFAVGDMHASMGDGEICGTGVEIAGEVTVRLDLLKGKQAEWPVSETEETWIAHGTAVEYPDAMREACREAARLLAGEWGMSMEDAFILLSIRGDVGVAQACKPSPFASIARVVLPKLEGIPAPFRT